MNKKFALLLSAAVLSTTLSTAALADDDNSDERLDGGYSLLNPDGGEDGISPDEWGSGFDHGGRFDNWDTNGDGMLSREEHRNGYFSCFDKDKNGRINREEHHRARRDINRCGWFDR